MLKSFTPIRANQPSSKRNRPPVCCAGFAILLLSFDIFGCRADHPSARSVPNWSEGCSSGLLSFCYTCEHRFERASKRRQEQGSARIKISTPLKTIDFIEQNTLFSCEKRVVVGDGFEPSKT